MVVGTFDVQCKLNRHYLAVLLGKIPPADGFGVAIKGVNDGLTGRDFKTFNLFHA